MMNVTQFSGRPADPQSQTAMNRSVWAICSRKSSGELRLCVGL